MRIPFRRVVNLWAEEIRVAATWRTGRRRLARRVAIVWAIETAGLVLLAHIVPGIRVTNWISALAGVITVALLNAGLRPILLYLALPLTILSFGLLVFLVNAIVLLLAGAIVPGFEVAGLGPALVGAIGLAVVNAIVTGFLDLNEEESFYRHVAQRWVRRGRPERRAARPGLLVIQVDGLGAPVLRTAIRTGQMPHVARLLRDGSHRLVAWECGLPSQTSASQAGLLHGIDGEIPAFRWYDK
ncbi:MAG TPA: phage holin family protein, partial [Candidatus Limnocylindrales bacterium]